MNEWLNQVCAYWQSGGLLLVPIAAVSFGIWGCFLRSRDVLVGTLREGRVLEEAWDRGEFAGPAGAIGQRLARFRGGVAAMLRLAVADIRRGIRPMEALLAREAECMRLLRRDFVVMGALTAVAPLLGLLGTVMGMIETFDAVAAVAGNPGGRVAGGISRALITTQFGLVVALPGVFGLARLQRMLRSVQVLMAETRAHALEALEGAARNPGADTP